MRTTALTQKTVLAIVTVLLACSAFAGGKPAREKMSVDEAIRRIQDRECMEKTRVSHADGVAAAFKGLPDNEAQEALARLMPLLRREDLGFGHFHLSWAFVNLGPASLPPLLKAVEEDLPRKSWHVVRQAIPWFGIDAIEPLLPLLAHQKAEVRLRAATLLQRACVSPGWAVRKPNAADLLPAAAVAVGKLLEDESVDVAVQAGDTLSAMGPHARSAIDAIAAAMAAGNPQLRRGAIRAAGRLGKDAVSALPALIKALNDPDAEVRVQAADSLVAVAEEDASIPILIEALSDEDGYVAVEVALILAKLGAPALGELANALSGARARQRRMAAFALGRIGPEAKSAVPALVQALGDKTEAVQVNAIDALASIGDQAAIAPLVKCLDVKSRLVRYKAIAGLGTVAPQDAEVGKLTEKARTRLAGEATPVKFERPEYVWKGLETMIGGPLNGVKLPRCKTHHGEEPGYPGTIERLRETDQYGNILFSSQGQQPEVELYPGAVEHYRSYWFKYLSVRSFFDAQSQIRSWVAKELPGVEAAQVEPYEEPVYWVSRHGGVKSTGLKNAAVSVVRCKPEAPVIKLDLGTLPIGMYAVRVIGAVPTDQLQPHRKPLYLYATVNDSTYKLRLGYVDEFYSVAEVYFHTVEKRRFRARLWVGEGSQVDLLIHRIVLDDALAGIDRRPIKKRMTLISPDERARLREETIRQWEAKQRRGRKWVPAKPYSTEEQWVRDAMFWKMWPRLNAQPGGNYGPRAGYQDDLVFGTGAGPGGGAPQEQDAAEGRWGKWTVGKGPYSALRSNPGLRQVRPCLALLIHHQFRLAYTFDDLAEQKPLPDPYPHKDDGTGLYFPPAKDDGGPQYFNPVANAISSRLFDWKNGMNSWIKRYHEQGDIRAGRDAAIALIRMAYDMPGIDPANAFSALLADPGPWGREHRCRRRTAAYFPWGPAPEWYEKLFDVIHGNEELAASVSRFIPWVKNSADVITLLDSYLLQNHAKRVMRYQYLWDNAPMLIVDDAIILDDAKVTEPWMQWLFDRAYIYPNPTSGIQDLISTANGRDGAGYIASWSYCIGEEASKNGDKLAKYIALGGNPRYDLRNPKLYPRATAACYWPLRTLMAGLYFPRIGDVNGPDKYWGHGFAGLEPRLRRGWEWTRDPVFAWMLRHHYGRKGESDEEWAAVEEAAGSIPRAPYLTQPSRVLANWFGLLEAGQEHDDPRFRRAVMLRTGLGWGHHHHDTLDLQIYAHGYPMTIDGGQRPKYSRPPDRATYVHNLVEVDGKQWMGHSWIRTMCDPPGGGARYMQAEAVPTKSHANVKYLRRQVAMVDVDEGRGSQLVPPEALFPGKPLKQEGVVSPNSYVLDVVRVSGGTTHTYCFHAMIDDKMTVNVKNRQEYGRLPEVEREYLSQFKKDEPRFGGDAPDTVVATWRYTRDSPAGSEKAMNPLIWDAASPRKFTRLHLLGQSSKEGSARILSGSFDCYRWKYRWSQLFVQHRGDKDTDRVFPAIIEPYVDEPFIAGAKLLAVENNNDDAQKAVAVEIKTTNGHTDVVFADGQSQKTRKVGEASFAAEFAAVSTDAQGLRFVSLTGGTLVRTPLVTLKLARAQYTGKVTKADYLEKTFRIDAEWPAFEGGERAVEIGSGAHWTTYMATAIAPDGKGSLIRLRNGATLYASRVLEVDEESNTVYCALMLPFLDHNETAPVPGLHRDLVVCNREMTRFWRADYLGGDRSAGKFAFRLDGPVSEEDFAKTHSLRAMEYGVGDTVRIPAFASLLRIEDNVYELRANADVKVTLADGKVYDVKLPDLARNKGRTRIAVRK